MKITQLEIFQTLCVTPHLTSSEIGEIIDMPLRTVNHNLRRMLKAGYVVRTRTDERGCPFVYSTTIRF